MRRLSLLCLALLVAILAGCAAPSSQPAPTAPPAKAKAPAATIAHTVLELEADLGAGPKEVKRLNRVVNKASAEVALQPRGGQARAHHILRTIDRVVRSNYGYQERRLFFEGLSGGGLDCDLFTIVYLAVAQRQHLPIKAVVAPRHSFVRWHFSNGQYLDWETTVGAPKDDSYYLSGDYLGETGPNSRSNYDLDQAVAQGAYLRSLTPSEFMAVPYVNAGVAHMMMGKKSKDTAYSRRHLQRAYRLFTQAIQRDPKRVEAYHGLGLVKLFMGNKRGALASLNQAAQLFPGNPILRFDRGTLRLALGDTDGAIKDFQAAWYLRPNDKRTAFSLSVAYGQKNDKKQADLWWKRSMDTGGKLYLPKP